MSHDRPISPVHSYRLSYLPWGEAPICAPPDNVSAEPKSEITLATDSDPDVNTHPKPTRPARHPRRPTPLRISPKSPPSFDSRVNMDSSFPSISPISIPPKDPSERIVWLSPASCSSASSCPSFQSGFLDRIPKPIASDDDSASTLSSITSRLPSVPPLCSYKRPLADPTRDKSDEICSLPVKLPRHDLLSKNAGAPAEESPLGSNFVNLTTDGKKTVISPLSFMRMRTASETSFSPPVTASTLTNASILSFTVDDSAAEMSETDPAVKAKRALFWKLKNRSRGQVNLDVYEEVFPEPSFPIAPSNVSSIPELAAPPSALRLEIRPDEEVQEDNAQNEDVKVGEGGFDSIRYRTRGAIRRVWHRLVGGQ